MNQYELKAQELIEKFYNLEETGILRGKDTPKNYRRLYIAKKGATILCDEIIAEIPKESYGTKTGYYPNPKFIFWQEVKQILEKT